MVILLMKEKKSVKYAFRLTWTLDNVECAIAVSETDKKRDICIESDDGTIEHVLNESEDQMEDDDDDPSCSANSLKRSTSAASFSRESNYDDDVTNLASSHQLPREFPIERCNFGYYATEVNRTRVLNETDK